MEIRTEINDIENRKIIEKTDKNQELVFWKDVLKIGKPLNRQTKTKMERTQIKL